MNLHSRRLKSEARDLFRNGILQAAEQVFAVRGFHAARIQDIARRARIAVGTVYNHFEDKDDVLAALLEERTAEMAACLAPAAGDPEEFGARLERRVGRLMAYAGRHRGFVLSHGLGARRRKDRLWQAWLAVVDEGLAAGALAPLGREALASYVAAVVRGMIGEGGAAVAARLILRGAGA